MKATSLYTSLGLAVAALFSSAVVSGLPDVAGTKTVVISLASNANGQLIPYIVDTSSHALMSATGVSGIASSGPLPDMTMSLDGSSGVSEAVSSVQPTVESAEQTGVVIRSSDNELNPQASLDSEQPAATPNEAMPGKDPHAEDGGSESDSEDEASKADTDKGHTSASNHAGSPVTKKGSSATQALPSMVNWAVSLYLGAAVASRLLL